MRRITSACIAAAGLAATAAAPLPARAVQEQAFEARTTGVKTVTLRGSAEFGSVPALDNTCRLACLWAGVIEFVSPGQATVHIP